MYKVADNMERIMSLAEIPLGWYTKEDIEYMQEQFRQTRELISEGAVAAVYSSSKSIIAKVHTEYQMRLDMQDPPYTVEEKERIFIFNTIRNNIYKMFLAYKKGDIEKYMFDEIWKLYTKVLLALHD